MHDAAVAQVLFREHNPQAAGPVTDLQRLHVNGVQKREGAVVIRVDELLREVFVSLESHGASPG
jgi:hypothetical protein